MERAAPIDETALVTGESGAPAPAASADDLSWAVVQMHAGERVVVNEALIAAYQAASSPHSIRALKSDLEAFDLWCRRHNRVALPASPETVADYLDARAEKGSKPASLGRYKASIAKIHMLLDLKDPTPASLVKLRLQAIRRRLGTAQKQARPLRFKGPVRNVERDEPRGLNVRALLECCAEDLPGLRDRALLSAGYDTGLRASELVAIEVEHIIEAIDPDARLLSIPRSKGDQEGEGATAYLSPRTVRAIAAWLEAAGIGEGAVFRRVNVRRYKAKAAVRGRSIDSISGRESWDLRKTLSKSAVPARVEYDVGEGALHPASVGPIYRSMIQRAFDCGALADLTADDLVRLLKGISAHSTRVGLNQDLFTSGEDLAGIMDALRWKSPRMPLAYNRNLAAEQGAAGRLMVKLG
ncbi:site-specific recombinase XerD [Sphingomonas sp. BE270]|mgnify:FL=1|jgi:site-specific recombinase XerD|uniref:integrase n=3 Tax=Alphaproteobacteria TaxID=28211 RepID=UPI002861A400|nr:tyrosine-type recombinase/integrase [Xanthobacteraceae bacterium]MDR6848980.1 site-specific recombinase XerD [Sphingomonas sp. BE137]MDR7260466.1 site-specific recombinase XerD [Sphingomonas sp. BE270]